jgi:hypothetical protein
MSWSAAISLLTNYSYKQQKTTIHYLKLGFNEYFFNFLENVEIKSIISYFSCFNNKFNC